MHWSRLSITLGFALAAVSAFNASAQILPNPVVYLTSTETFTASGREFTRFRYAVLNSDSYPDALFAASPSLPPCGSNTRASRSWVDLYDQQGRRLYGFCALGKAGDLNGIWFALPSGDVPPSYIYIEINDRQTGTKYKSNLADTVM